ncbi:hypothetical protein [Acidihalobacter ferrooxydans]|uniref:Uncharacterized protein n=1 Tax=Acidihalobacter ferrooxydans TaxID=1765967 RepID=A0A1P8UKH5_9GAMM|nr:hypothetical protein [Acidihalobacter ferrooxydans]APZ44333.1 hypothetical protein BW247_15575 [Acidihalobacter ferrooxydans]
MIQTQKSKLGGFLTSLNGWLYIWLLGTPILLLASILTSNADSAYLAFGVQLPWLILTMVLGSLWTLRASSYTPHR